MFLIKFDCCFGETSYWCPCACCVDITALTVLPHFGWGFPGLGYDWLTRPHFEHLNCCAWVTQEPIPTFCLSNSPAEAPCQGSCLLLLLYIPRQQLCNAVWFASFSGGLAQSPEMSCNGFGRASEDCLSAIRLPLLRTKQTLLGLGLWVTGWKAVRNGTVATAANELEQLLVPVWRELGNSDRVLILSWR